MHLTVPLKLEIKEQQHDISVVSNQVTVYTDENIPILSFDDYGNYINRELLEDMIHLFNNKIR